MFCCFCENINGSGGVGEEGWWAVESMDPIELGGDANGTEPLSLVPRKSPFLKLFFFCHSPVSSLKVPKRSHKKEALVQIICSVLTTKVSRGQR